MPLEKRSGRGLRYSDPEVCKLALAGLCPYGLFKNTKSDLGAAATHFSTMLLPSGAHAVEMRAC